MKTHTPKCCDSTSPHSDGLLQSSLARLSVNSMRRSISVLLLVAVFQRRSSSKRIPSEDVDGICGNSFECGEKCRKIYDVFSKENGKSHWMAKYPSIARTFQEYGVNSSIEIGVARGGLSYYLLSTVQSLLVHHGIDSFGGGNSNDFVTKRQSVSCEWARAVLHHLSDFSCRFRLHKGFAAQLTSHFQRESIDCILFDADHSYGGIVTDIVNYAPIVRPGGLMIFDDYDELDFRGVHKAVRKFAKQNNLSIIKLNDDGNVMIVKPFNRPLNLTFGSATPIVVPYKTAQINAAIVD